jgi:hypothetical protein
MWIDRAVWEAHQETLKNALDQIDQYRTDAREARQAYKELVDASFTTYGGIAPHRPSIPSPADMAPVLTPGVPSWEQARDILERRDREKAQAEKTTEEAESK